MSARPWHRVVGAVCLCAATQAGPAWAKDKGEAADAPGFLERVLGPACLDTADLGPEGDLPSLIVCPQLTLEETFEDNAFRSTDETRSDLGTVIRPAITLSGEAGGTVVGLTGEIAHNRQARFGQNDYLDWTLGLDAAPVTDPGGGAGLTVLTAGFEVARQHEDRADPDSTQGGADLNTFREARLTLALDRDVGPLAARAETEIERTDFLRTAEDNGNERERLTLRNTLRLNRLISGTRRPAGAGTPSLQEVSFANTLGPPGGGATGGSLGPTSALSAVAEVSYTRSFFDVAETRRGREQGNQEIAADLGLAYTFSDVTDLSLRAGVSRTDFEDPDDETETVPEINAALSWLPTDLTLVRIESETRLEQTQAGEASASLIRDNRVEVQHALDYDLRLRLDAGVALETFRGSAQRNIDWDVSVGADWALNEALLLSGTYTREIRRSTGGADFESNTVVVDLTARF